jgi:hypothetical protein
VAAQQLWWRRPGRRRSRTKSSQGSFWCTIIIMLIIFSISTGQIAATYYTRIDNTCKFCVVDETDFHLFCVASIILWRQSFQTISLITSCKTSLLDFVTFGMQGMTGSTIMKYRLNHEVQVDIVASICLSDMQV